MVTFLRKLGMVCITTLLLEDKLALADEMGIFFSAIYLWRISRRLGYAIPLFSGCHSIYITVEENNSWESIFPSTKTVLHFVESRSHLSFWPNASLRGRRTTPSTLDSNQSSRHSGGVLPLNYQRDIDVWMKVLPPRHRLIFIYIPRQNFQKK